MLLLAGCSAGGASDESGGVAGSPVQAPGIVSEDAAIDGFSTESEGEVDADREVIVTGTMTVTAEDPSDAAREAVRIVETAGGRVDARSEYAPSGGDLGSASLTLRIPADKLQGVLDDLAALGRDGKADEVSTYTQDVTVLVADLESRIATQRGIIERLNALFASATTIQDLIELETTIAQHQSELENLEAQQRATDDQVSLSTLNLYVRSEAEAPVEAPLDFLGGLQTGWGAFVGFFSGLLVALGVLLPWLVTAGLITAATIYFVRRRRARAAAKA
jgi:uncharacterized small protein (DUF1192 family)